MRCVVLLGLDQTAIDHIQLPVRQCGQRVRQVPSLSRRPLPTFAPAIRMHVLHLGQPKLQQESLMLKLQ